jgi:hypothetical protein
MLAHQRINEWSSYKFQTLKFALLLFIFAQRLCLDLSTYIHRTMTSNKTMLCAMLLHLRGIGSLEEVRGRAEAGLGSRDQQAARDSRPDTVLD